MSEKPIWLPIQSYKHDGSLHRCWDRNCLLEETDQYLIVASQKTRVIEANGRFWYTREPSVTFFAKNEWWNTIAMIKPDGISFYTNIASPSLIDDGIIKYIDYDVDIKVFANGETKLLDEREYYRHAREFDYGKKIDEVIRFEVDQLMKKIKLNESPYNVDVVNHYYQIFKQLIEKNN